MIIILGANNSHILCLKCWEIFRTTSKQLTIPLYISLFSLHLEKHPEFNIRTDKIYLSEIKTFEKFK